MLKTGLFELNAVAAISAHRSFRAAATESAFRLRPEPCHRRAGKRLGVRLINRTTRSVALSEAGQRFLARVSPALARSKAPSRTSTRSATPRRERCASTPRNAAAIRSCAPSSPGFCDAIRHAGRTDHGRTSDRYRRAGFDAGIASPSRSAGHGRRPLRSGLPLPRGRRARLFRTGAGAAVTVGLAVAPMHSQAYAGWQPVSVGIRKARRGDRGRRAGPADADNDGLMVEAALEGWAWPL